MYIRLRLRLRYYLFGSNINFKFQYIKQLALETLKSAHSGPIGLRPPKILLDDSRTNRIQISQNI